MKRARLVGKDVVGDDRSKEKGMLQSWSRLQLNVVDVLKQKLLGGTCPPPLNARLQVAPVLREFASVHPITGINSVNKRFVQENVISRLWSCYNRSIH